MPSARPAHSRDGHLLTCRSPRCRLSRCRRSERQSLIIGPHETPYEFGFFEVCRVHCSCAACPMLTQRQFTFKFNKGKWTLPMGQGCSAAVMLRAYAPLTMMPPHRQTTRVSRLRCLQSPPTGAGAVSTRISIRAAGCACKLRPPCLLSPSHPAGSTANGESTGPYRVCVEPGFLVSFRSNAAAVHGAASGVKSGLRPRASSRSSFPSRA